MKNIAILTNYHSKAHTLSTSDNRWARRVEASGKNSSAPSRMIALADLWMPLLDSSLSTISQRDWKTWLEKATISFSAISWLVFFCRGLMRRFSRDFCTLGLRHGSAIWNKFSTCDVGIGWSWNLIMQCRRERAPCVSNITLREKAPSYKTYHACMVNIH